MDFEYRAAFNSFPVAVQQDPHRQDRDRYVTFNSFPVAVSSVPPPPSTGEWYFQFFPSCCR
ncbi:MAG: hypothetical protein N3E41_08640 [Thermofilaceae archaeon]|nr:hypothetical protein [Thermofilaceae archaeon]